MWGFRQLYRAFREKLKKPHKSRRKVLRKNFVVSIRRILPRHGVLRRDTEASLLGVGLLIWKRYRLSFSAILHREYWEERRRRRLAVRRCGNTLHIRWTVMFDVSFRKLWHCLGQWFLIYLISEVWGTRNFLWTQNVEMYLYISYVSGSWLLVIRSN